uniref:Uncharacterized protein n=1 Tax=Oryza glumipatula TaxID=40148 RepID=A0A0D9ZX61_9ORYZ
MKYKIGLQTLTLIHSHFFPSAFPHTRGGGGGGGISLPRPVALIGVGTSLGVGGRLPHPESSRDDTGAEQEEAYGCGGGEPPSRRLRRWRGRTTRRRRAAGSPRSRSAVGPESVAAWRLTATATATAPYTGVSDGRVLKWIPLECRWGRALIRQPQQGHYGNFQVKALGDFHLHVARLLPITLGQVFKRIDVVSKDFGNIVDVELGGPWLLLPVEVMATLAHKFGIIGEVGICVQC